MLKSLISLTFACSVASCGLLPGLSAAPEAPAENTVEKVALYPGETLEMRELVTKYAACLDIPETLLHRVIQRESDYRADARSGPYYGLMQILPETARSMGHSGPPSTLLDAETNMLYAGRYLRGAWLLSYGDEATAVKWYSRGFYYEARDRGLLVETGLRSGGEKRCTAEEQFL